MSLTALIVTLLLLWFLCRFIARLFRRLFQAAFTLLGLIFVIYLAFLGMLK